MNPFTLAELEALASTQESAMMDTAVRMEATMTEDSAGQLIASFEDAETFSVGVQSTGGEEKQGAQAVTVAYDKMLRIPLGVTVLATDRVRLLTVGGRASGEVFEVVGATRVGPSAQLVPVRRVEI